MEKFQNVGTFDAGVFTPGLTGTAAPGGAPMAMDAAGIASGGAFLVSELEKRDTLLRKPLDSFTYPRDININTGGGWVDYVSAQSVAYGLTGGSGSGGVHAGGANGIPMVSTNVEKGVYKAHIFAAGLRVLFADMQKAAQIGRSLDQMLTDGLRTAYDKHMDQNVYAGMEDYGTTGLLNNPDVTETTVSTGASGKTEWAKKTPDEILADVNAALTANWAAAEYDPTALPNHILIPYEQYADILTRKVTELAASWRETSRSAPVQSGSEFVTTLENDKDYASYVNDGHDVDKHFVPGLYIDENGLLSYEPTGKDENGKKIGMMVGTQTTEVEGLGMAEKGIDKFKEVAEIELNKLPGEIFR